MERKPSCGLPILQQPALVWLQCPAPLQLLCKHPIEHKDVSLSVLYIVECLQLSYIFVHYFILVRIPGQI